MFEMNTSILLVARMAFSTVAIDLVSSPNNLKLSMFKKLVSLVDNLKLLAIYHLPDDAFITASLVLKNSMSALYSNLKRN